MTSQRDRAWSKDIFQAIELDDVKAVKEFVEKRGVSVTDVNHQLQTPAHIAAAKGNLKIFKYLVEKDPTCLTLSDSTGHYVPLLAIDHDHLDVVKYLVENQKINLCQQFDFMGSTLIHRAAEFGRLSILKYLVEEKRANVDVINKFNQPPIFLAAENRQFHVLRYLAEERNASLTMMDEHQHTILHIGIDNDDLTLLKYVLDERRADLDVNMRTKFGITLVQRAADLNRMEVLVYLVSNKHADVNAVNDWGESPLHSAARENHYEAYKYLVEHGADTQIKDHRGWDPAHYTTDNRIRTYVPKRKRSRRSPIQLSSLYLSTYPTSQMSQNPSSLVHFKVDTLEYFSTFQSFLTLLGPVIATARSSFPQRPFVSPAEMLNDRMDSTAIDSIDSFP